MNRYLFSNRNLSSKKHLAIGDRVKLTESYVYFRHGQHGVSEIMAMCGKIIDYTNIDGGEAREVEWDNPAKYDKSGFAFTIYKKIGSYSKDVLCYE